MNGDEQKDRQSLYKRLDAMDKDFLALMVQANKDRQQGDEDMKMALKAVILELIGEERTHRLQLAHEQRNYVDTQDAQHAKVLLAFLSMPWWKRYTWTLFGKNALRSVETTANAVQHWMESR